MFNVPVSISLDETSLEAGIRVQIHSQDEPPYIHQLGFGVSPGFQTFVSCQEQRVQLMSNLKTFCHYIGYFILLHGNQNVKNNVGCNSLSRVLRLLVTSNLE